MKQRLDVLLVEKGLATSRQQAQSLIMAGLVTVDGRRADKAGTTVASEADVQVERPEHPYVSRGGLKLEKALRTWNLDVTGKVALDVGASTGGFTHCLLLDGAARVYAIDVGYGQLDYRLRQDARVISKERVNARSLSAEDVPEPVDIAVIDVSFISLSLVLPAVTPRLKDQADVVALVKPQFEAGRGQVGKGGVVRDPAVHRAVLERVAAFVPPAGLTLLDLTVSPIKGPSGNIEFLAWMSKDARTPSGTVEAMVQRALDASF